jgi:hypothetical protein
MMLFGMLDRHFFSLATLICAALLFITGAVEFRFGNVVAALAATFFVPIPLAAACRIRAARSSRAPE